MRPHAHAGPSERISEPMLGASGANLGLPPGELRLRRPGPGGEEESVPVRSIAAGGYHTLVVTWSGEVWTFGANSHGQLGRPKNADAHSAPQPLRLPPPHEGQPVVALAAVWFGFMLGGSIVIETIFNLKGIGWLSYDALLRSDLPVVQAIVLIFASFYVVLTLLADLLNAYLDPRISVR